MRARHRLVLTLVGFRAVADASVIREYTAGPSTGLSNTPGSLSAPRPGAVEQHHLNWYVEETVPGPGRVRHPVLLTQEYLGTPAGLSPSTPGYIAHADSPAESYTRLTPPDAAAHQTYYFYANSFNVIYGGGDDAGATFYTSGRGDIPFVQFTTVDADYRLSGDVIEGGPGVPAPVPEPSALALIVLGTVGLLGASRSRRDIPPA